MKKKRRRDAEAAGFPDQGMPGDEPAPAAAASEVRAPAPDAAAAAEAPRPPLTLPWPPIIHPTAGFSLRPWGASSADAVALSDAWADPEVARWTKVPPEADVVGAQRWIEGDEARREAGLSLDLVIARVDDPESVLGEVGLVLVEPARLWAEVGFWLARLARGLGTASQAVELFSNWALTDLPVRRLFVRIHPENTKALAVVERAGYEPVGSLDDQTRVLVRDVPPIDR